MKSKGVQIFCLIFNLLMTFVCAVFLEDSMQITSIIVFLFLAGINVHNLTKKQENSESNLKGLPRERTLN